MHGCRCASIVAWWFLWTSATVLGHEGVEPTERRLRAVADGDFFGLFSIKTCSETSPGVFETTKTSRITALLRALLGTTNKNGNDISGACNILCSDLCPKTCYVDFKISSSTCTCNQSKCSGNALCSRSDKKCACKSGFNGNGLVCCDTNAGLTLVTTKNNSTTCQLPTTPKPITVTSAPVPPPAFGRDIRPPEILSFVARSSLSVNVTSGPGKIDFSMTVQDDLSGVQKVYVYAESSQGIAFALEPALPLLGPSRQLNFSLIIPSYTEQGNYFLYVAAHDNATNELELEPVDLANLQFPHDITVFNRRTDTTAPEVKKITPSRSLLPSVRINSTIVFELELQDDISGVSAVYMGLSGSLASSGTLWAFGRELYDCPAGNALCKARVSFEISRFVALDTYTFTMYTADFEGNDRQYNASQLTTLFGLPPSILFVK